MSKDEELQFLRLQLDKTIKEVELLNARNRNERNAKQVWRNKYYMLYDIHNKKLVADIEKKQYDNECDKLVSLVQSFYNIEFGNTKNLRIKDCVLARYVVMYYGHTTLGMSHQKISSYIGKDHATCVHACKYVDDTLYQKNVLKIKVKEYDNRMLDCLEFVKSQMNAEK